PAEPRVAERQSAHECHQYCDDRVACVSKEKRQISGPNDLINQARHPRNEKRTEYGPEYPAMGLLHVSIDDTWKPSSGNLCVRPFGTQLTSGLLPFDHC